MQEGIIGREAAQQQAEKLGKGEHDIEQIKNFRGGAGMGHQLAQGRARAFRPHQMGGSAGEPGQERQGEHQDAHAADPVGCGPPEHQPPGIALEAGEHGGAGGCEAGDGLKQRIHKAAISAGEEEGERTANAQHQPAGRHDEKAFLQPEMGPFFRPEQKPDCGADCKQAQHAEQKDFPILRSIMKRNDQGGEHGCPFHEQYGALNAENQLFIHL